MTAVSALLADLAARLARAGSGCPRLEAELLAAKALSLSRLDLRLRPGRDVAEEEATLLRALAERRLGGEPMAYVLGEKEFFGRPFRVGPGVLVPRPETELLVETVLEETDGRGGREAPLVFADLCAGSGCVGVTLALERPSWRGALLELHGAPLAACAANAAALGAGSVLTVAGDVFRAPLARGAFDVVAANPPYVAPEEEGLVAPDVLAREPREALFSPDGGLAALAACVRLAAEILAPGGLLAVEHGFAQGPAARALMAEKNFARISTKKDLAGLDRVTSARL